MKSSFAARRKARKIGQDDDEDEGGLKSSSAAEHGGEKDSTPVVKRPPLASTGSSLKPKKKSSLRLSFGPGEASSGQDNEEAGEVFTPKRSNLSRQAIEKNAVRKSLTLPISSDRLPLRPQPTDDRPSYSKDYLNELKTSTPSTPKDLKSLYADEGESKEALDIAAKFGALAETSKGSIIPTEAEIKEKKERRARLAHEPDFLALDDGDTSNEISLLPRKKKTETRLVREDEDLGEGFDEFVEDGKIALGKKAERDADRKRRVEMQELINDAEGDADESSEDSDADRKAAYEAAQTRAGTYGNKDANRQLARPRTPPRITPLPNLGTVLQRLQSTLSAMELARMQKVQKMEDLQHEKTEIANREVEIQKLLKESGERYESLRAEAGIGGESAKTLITNGEDVRAEPLVVNRGLESFGNTPIRPPGDP
ncbi:MAG: hypothetical protein M1819_002878 [Sarea resinae]|nr:MAG: hypothetical protein M1819_002878 [Sarea resinae]